MGVLLLNVCHALCGCGDVGVTLCVDVLMWVSRSVWVFWCCGCHALCGCVDVGVTLCVGVLVLSECHALCGCVDAECVSRSVCGCVDAECVSRSVWVC